MSRTPTNKNCYKHYTENGKLNKNTSRNFLASKNIAGSIGTIYRFLNKMAEKEPYT